MSDDGDVTGNHGISDLWVVKLDSAGGIEWQRNLGGTSTDVGYAARQTLDSGYVVLGWTFSSDGDVIGNHGIVDVWVLRLDANGVVQWQKCLGGSQWEMGRSILQTADGGFLVYAETESNDGDVSGYIGGGSDNWVVKLDPQGTMLWEKCLGGSASEWAGGITQATDGSYILAGYTYSNDSMVSGNHGFSDTWVAKLDTTGELLWQQCIGVPTTTMAAP
ncbi:MAG: hypothetical protein IPG10_12535 [Flavobacteriales bacterium]|nr:hypothetical protein [Flavobacteriales bacterium]